MPFVSSSILFLRTIGEPTPMTERVTFGTNITTAVALLTGFHVEFSKAIGKDHPLGRIVVQVDATPATATEVDVTARLGLRDWSGDWDDPYEGVVFFTVYAE
ncbi:MAG TPA: hypothetical protein VEU30_05005 [Thermoanaerobaculia bacterium]|nr:hypothetical protein [Thermoanaerobaculia bacterium]